MSKRRQWIELAFARGYVVDDDGTVVGPRGARSASAAPNGFLRFSIHTEERGNYGHIFVHQLAAYQQFGEESFGDGVKVIHLDGDRMNNALSNIALGTQSAAMFASIPRHMRVAHAVHAARKLRSLSDAQVADLRERRRNGATLRQLCAAFGIAKSTASYIVNGKTYPR